MTANKLHYLYKILKSVHPAVITKHKSSLGLKNVLIHATRNAPFGPIPPAVLYIQPRFIIRCQTLSKFPRIMWTDIVL
jgi:hypothetical protein